MENSPCHSGGHASRRAVLQAGIGGLLGLPLTEFLRAQARGAEIGKPVKKTAVIYLELAGGPTQHETYDPKPLSPAEYRGPLGVVQTKLPGVQFSEYMARQAGILDKLVVLRSIHHSSGSHGTSAHLTQTGYYLRDRQNRENEMPCLGSYVAKLRGPNARAMPAFVSVPRAMRYGQSAWLGKGFSPFETVGDVSQRDFRVPNLTLLEGLDGERIGRRQELLAGFDQSRRILDTQGVAEATDRFVREAFELVTGDQARRAFEMSLESAATRERYGLNSFGQNVLLARRLVEHGVTLVTVRANSLGSWDDHVNIADSMRRKGPGYDQAVAALVEDLYERGLQDQVLVVCMGEFGRTPTINRSAGRDHWGQLMSVVLAGGGLAGGRVIGASDPYGREPVDSPYLPENVLATVYRHLGIDSSQTFADSAGRPRYVLELREPIRELT